MLLSDSRKIKKKYPSGYPSIGDKSICHNAEQFPDLKGLVNCGFAKVKFTTWENKEYNFTTCYYSPDNQFPEELKILWRYFYFIDKDLFEILEWADVEYEKNAGNKGNKIFKKKKQKKIGRLYSSI